MASVVLIAVMILGAVLACPQAVFAQGKADQVKAVFLFKFFDYVTWPAGADGDGLLCTYGPNNFGDTLDYIAARKSGDFHFRVQSIGAMEEGGKCKVLYLTRSRYDRLSALPPDSGVLTVGDADGFLEAGGVIQMKEDEGKVRLVIDLQNAKKNGLKISSRLLDIAEVRK